MDGKRAALTGYAINTDLTTVLLDDAVAYGQTEPSAFAGAFCRKERIEDTV